ncbi:MAG: glutamine-hydrolyzing carbamoyl-phosphate synthase small subunit [Firmicutes bacterium]|nr:glutamine-hydrolyzing carbamoyl-phosphate synthase small subunit [Bacillota bacterium]
MAKTAYLLLQNGKSFKGTAFGAEDISVAGEVVFTTGMTAYMETLTDPNFFGQIVVQTFPLIGNYGAISEDMESEKIQVKAYIAREICQEPSNFRSEGNLDIFLKERGIPGLCGIDTRALTKLLRENGTMNGKIVPDLDNIEADLKELNEYRIENAIDNVTCKEIQTISPEGKPKKRVVLWDFGVKASFKQKLVDLGFEVVAVPAFSSAEEILSLNPDGIMLTNGPGNPADYESIINEIRRLINIRKPIFGICLGHQLLALAMGGKTEKLPYGHRGSSQPVKEISSGRVFITGQNHGYAVSKDNLPSNARMSFVNVNDGSCEGIEYTDLPLFSVQFYPDTEKGALGTGFLFDKFIANMERGNK